MAKLTGAGRAALRWVPVDLCSAHCGHESLAALTKGGKQQQKQAAGKCYKHGSDSVQEADFSISQGHRGDLSMTINYWTPSYGPHTFPEVASA